MRHDWILDVLTDMSLYADRNGLPGLKAKIEETLVVARIEARIDAAAGPRSELEDQLLRFRTARRAH